MYKDVGNPWKETNYKFNPKNAYATWNTNNNPFNVDRGHLAPNADFCEEGGWP